MSTDARFELLDELKTVKHFANSAVFGLEKVVLKPERPSSVERVKLCEEWREHEKRLETMMQKHENVACLDDATTKGANFL